MQRRDRKKRLYNIDRYRICMHAQNHPGMKQEDIAAQFGVERSTVSKILKQKARWLSVSPTEKVLVAKLRYLPFILALLVTVLTFVALQAFEVPYVRRPSGRLGQESL